MVNIARKKSAAAAEQHFIAEFASLLAPWGMAGSPGLVYGYILSKGDRVTTHQIATDLKISKVSAWKAAKELENFGHIRRYGEAGSKRALYGAADNFAVPMLKQAVLLASLSGLLEQSAAAFAPGTAAERLKEMSVLYRAVNQAIEGAVRQFEAGRPGKGKP